MICVLRQQGSSCLAFPAVALWAQSSAPASSLGETSLTPSTSHATSDQISRLSPLLPLFAKDAIGGAWVAQSVKWPTSAQVMISQSMSSSPASGSGLTAQSLEPVSDSVSPSLSAPPLFMLCLSLSQK